MNLEITLGNKHRQTVVIEAEIFNTDYNIPVDEYEPDVVDYNMWNDPLKAYSNTMQKLKDAIAKWNSIAIHYDTEGLTLGDILGITAMSNSAATCYIEDLTPRIEELKNLRFADDRWARVMHQEVLNPMQSRMIIIYRLLVDQHIIRHLDDLLKCLTILKRLRSIVTQLITSKSSQGFCLHYHNDNYLYDDEDFENFTFEKQPGDIFIAPTAIGYSYDNVCIEEVGNKMCVKMTPNSFDLIDQETYYTGKLLFYCGSSITHEQYLAKLNHSLDVAWGGYKIKKTDTTNKYQMLSFGLIKVGKFDPVPTPGFNEIRNYVIR